MERYDCYDYKRWVNIAMDVLLSFEQDPLNFQDLIDAKTDRSILNVFINAETLNATSKIKYINQFEKFLLFLFNYVDSPEMSEEETSENMLTRDIKIKLFMKFEV